MRLVEDSPFSSGGVSKEGTVLRGSPRDALKRGRDTSFKGGDF